MTWEGIFEKMSSNSQSLTFDAKLLREGRAVRCAFFFFSGEFQYNLSTLCTVDEWFGTIFCGAC